MAIKRLLPLALLSLLLPAPLWGQPGELRAELEQAIDKAIVENTVRRSHLYAKSRIERRWVEAYFNGHPTLTHIATDDAPRWYDFLYRRPSRGFYFDIKTGSDLGGLSMLDKGLTAAMRRAMLAPQEAEVGMDGAVVTYYMVEHVPYDETRFDQWMERERSIIVPWYYKNTSDGTVSLAFVPREQERAFRRHNDYAHYERFFNDDLKPMAAYLVDFDWFSKTNFLLETDGLIFYDSVFVPADPSELSNCVYVKHYDKLYVWENGFLRGCYPLTGLDSLNACWNQAKQTHDALRSRGQRGELVRSIRRLPFDEQEHHALLAHYEDSIYKACLTRLNTSENTTKACLERYFTIYGRYEGQHAAAIDSAIARKAAQSMEWVRYYLLTYEKGRAHHYNEMDSLAHDVMLKDFSQAQTYKELFPNGRYLRDADEIIAYEKACRLYDHTYYSTRYPDGAYHERFMEYMNTEEERLYREAKKVYRLETRADFDEVMRSAISPYRNHFSAGKHIREVNEMYYYCIAFQKKMSNIYSNHYSMSTNRGSRLQRLINQESERQVRQDDEQRTLKQHKWLHKRLMSQPLSKYVELEDLDDGGYKITAIKIFLPGQKGSRRCCYESEASVVIGFDKEAGVFYIDEGEGRRYRSDSVFLTLRRYLMDGYEQNYGILYNCEQWLMENCDDIPYNP